MKNVGLIFLRIADSSGVREHFDSLHYVSELLPAVSDGRAALVLRQSGDME